MEYEGQICRAPMERASYMLPVAVGCSYNACKFCTLFKHLSYRELPMEQVEAELQRVRQAGGDPRKVFLGDGNAFGLETEKLLYIIEMVHRYFPSCAAIHMDATVTNVSLKTQQELRALQEAGVRRLYLGIESGLADVLVQMNKEHTLAQAYTQIERLHAAGIDYAAHIMTGIAGKGRGQENAAATAEFLNRTRPVAVCNFSVFMHKRAHLWKDVEAGRYAVADVLECLEEERRLIALLDVPLDYDGFHDAVAVRTRGRLPGDREKMLAKLDRAIAVQQDKPPVYAIVDRPAGVAGQVR